MGGKCVFGCAVDVSTSRALPGHSILWVHRFGASVDPEVLDVAIRVLAAFARSQRRILSLHVELFSRVPQVHRTMEDVCPRWGFRRLPAPRLYRETVILDLAPSIEQVFASLHATGRRHIRAIAKNPVRVGPINERGYGERLGQLMTETFRRTGARPSHNNWGELIDFCNRHPSDARIVGLFQNGVEGPRSLLSFALGYNHGDHVEYADAASTRKADLHMPLAYGVAWDLVTWAKSVGATWFDFGGITPGTQDDPKDPRGGIADFKRYFTHDVVHVGDEWVLEPHALRAHAARAVSTLASRVRGLLLPISG